MQIEPVNPEGWEIENCWFVRQQGLNAKLTRKEKQIAAAGT